MAFEAAEMDKYREVFEAFDIDNNGSITHDELKTALGQLGYNLSDDEVQELIDDADDDGDGTISASEFVRVMTGKPKPDRQKAQMRRMFRALDVDGSGFITVDNLREILAESDIEVDDDRLAAMIAEGDSDDDGRISFEEFVAMVDENGDFL